MLCVLFGQHHATCAVHSTQQGVKRAGTAQKQISHGSLQHLEELQLWPWFLIQPGLSMAVSDVESQPVIPVDGSPHLSTSRENQKDSAGPGPAAASLCGASPVQMSRSVGTRKHRILLLQIKKPTSFNSFNLDSSTNSKEAPERLLDYTEKGKMLKERLLTQSWIKRSSPGLPGCWERLPHTVSRFTLGSNTSRAPHQMQMLV